MVKELESGFEDIVVSVEEVNVGEPDKWYTIKEQSYFPDRREFILKEFRKDFPAQLVDDYDFLANLVSRNSMLEKWFTKTNLLYRKDVEVPRYLGNVIEPEKYALIEKNLVIDKKLISEESEEIRFMSEEYDRKIDAIKTKFKNLREKNKISNEVKILSLKSNQLPLSLSIAIENFTPGGEENAPTSKAYAREVLINYQLGLLKIIKDRPDIDIDKVIEVCKVK